VWALVSGLPPEAAVWRQNAFTPTEELLAQFLERHDEWARSHLQALLHHKKVTVPPEVHIMRPGEEPEPARKVETDPLVIAAWFKSHIG
jgi:hypothetical protein